MRHLSLINYLEAYIKLATDNLTINLDGRMIDIKNTSREELYKLYIDYYQRYKREGKEILDQLEGQEDNSIKSKYRGLYQVTFNNNVFNPDSLLRVMREGVTDENSGEKLTGVELEKSINEWFYDSFGELVFYQKKLLDMTPSLATMGIGNRNQGKGKKIIGPGGEEFSKEYLGEIVREMVGDLVGVYGIKPVSIDVVFMTGIGGGKILVVGREGDIYLNNNMGEYVTGKYFSKVSKRINNYGSYMIPSGWRLRVYP